MSDPFFLYSLGQKTNSKEKVMTTGGAGGLITPYKGNVTDTP